jgi:hypothetical protein
MEFNPVLKSFDVYSDADFSGNWNPDIAEHEQATARSRSGYAIRCAGCTIACKSKLQSIFGCHSRYEK